MGNILQYEAIVPIEWLSSTPDEIYHSISSQLELYRISEKLDGAIITHCNLATTIQISDINMTWWFQVLGDSVPSPWRYYFTGNLLVEMYPDLEVPWRREMTRMIEEGEELSASQSLQYSSIINPQHQQQQQQPCTDFVVKYLKHEAIIPKPWLNTFTLQYVVNAFSRQVNELSIMINNVNEQSHRNHPNNRLNIQRLNQPLITIGTISAYLIINDENHYWWLRMQTDVTTTPSLESYHFTGNLINELCIAGINELTRRYLHHGIQQQQQQDHKEEQMSDNDSLPDTIIIDDRDDDDYNDNSDGMLWSDDDDDDEKSSNDDNTQ